MRQKKEKMGKVEKEIDWGDERGTKNILA